jgi:hypothetical protein
MKKIVVATTTNYPVAQDFRPGLALMTLDEISAFMLDSVVVDGGSYPGFAGTARGRGAWVINATGSTMGAARRQAMAEAGKLAGAEGIVVWMEPEQVDFVRWILPAASAIYSGTADMVIPTRASLDSYPLEHQQTDILGNLAVEYLLGRRLDFWFDVVIMNQWTLKLALEYEGDYGDQRDSTMIPILRALTRGYQVDTATVEYEQRLEQTEAEAGDLDLLLKRAEQLQTIVPALRQEAAILGLQPRSRQRA